MPQMDPAMMQRIAALLSQQQGGPPAPGMQGGMLAPDGPPATGGMMPGGMPGQMGVPTMPDGQFSGMPGGLGGLASPFDGMPPGIQPAPGMPQPGMPIDPRMFGLPGPARR